MGDEVTLQLLITKRTNHRGEVGYRVELLRSGTLAKLYSSEATYHEALDRGVVWLREEREKRSS